VSLACVAVAALGGRLVGTSLNAIARVPGVQVSPAGQLLGEPDLAADPRGARRVEGFLFGAGS
jgi:hypothetical protein